MSARTVTVRVTRPVRYDARAWSVGETLDVPPLHAGELVGSGRAELVNEAAARPIVAAATLAERNRVVELAERTQRGGWPHGWRR
jgi:hypothetical protein